MTRTRFAAVLSAAYLAAACGAKTNGSPSTDNPGDDQPVVSASANVISGVAPLEVEFAGVAAGGDGALTYKWNFGDGDNATGLNPTHTYLTAGTFSAAFTATDSDGDFATATVTISSGSAAAPAITASANVSTGIAPLTVNFTSAVVGGDAPVQVVWTFGDGETAAQGSPSHIYANTGSYTATVKATDANGDFATATIPIAVGNDATPVVTLTATPTSGAAPLAVAFTSAASGGNAPLTFAWTFGDGGVATTANANHTYMANGNYGAKIVVTDADGDQANATVTIVVNNMPSTKPDLQLANFGNYETGLEDDYEPNDARVTAYYLGDYGSGPAPAVYTVGDAYVDAVEMTYYVDVVNVGNALNTPFDVDFYKNSAAAPSPTLDGDEYETITNLGANATRRLYYTVANPPTGTASKSWIRVDTYDDIDEQMETNNLSTGLNVTPMPDEDWYEVYQDAAFDITIALDQLPADYDVRIYNDAGTIVASSVNSGTAAEAITYTAPTTGYYQIKVYGYSGAQSSGTPYRLVVNVEY